MFSGSREELFSASIGIEPKLLDRQRELSRLAVWLADVGEGRGRIGLIVGGAGLGKTALLRRAQLVGERLGVRVLSARGGELERELPFGVARQLLERTVRAMSIAERRRVLAGAASHAAPLLGLGVEATRGADPSALIHGLYWLLANVAESGPLLLTVDDLHWADRGTLRWLSFLEGRVEELPVLIVATSRHDVGEGGSWLGDLARVRPVERICPAPLRFDAVAEVVRTQSEEPADPEFVRACHEATGGNPFFLRELLRAAKADGVKPVADDAGRVPYLSTSEVRRSILLRLARLGDPARRLATATSVLGDDAELRHAAALSGLALPEALQAWDALGRAEILEATQPLEFIHPIARAAVYGELAPGERSQHHRRAAEVLSADGAEPARVAVHASKCEPSGDGLIVSWLRRAAAEATASGALEAAARFLQRACAEPPDPALRPQLQFELGQALMGFDADGAAGSFQSAAQAGEPSSRVRALRWAAYALEYAGRMNQAIAALDDAVMTATANGEDELELRGTRKFYAAWWPADADRVERSRGLAAEVEGLAGTSRGARRLLAAAAVSAAMTGVLPAAKVMELAHRAYHPDLSWVDTDYGNETLAGIGNAAIVCDATEALDIYELALAQCSERGWIVNVAAGYYQRAAIRLRRGDLRAAEQDARTSWSIVSSVRDQAADIWQTSAAHLLRILIACGRIDEADTIATSIQFGKERPERMIRPWPPVVLGELALAAGRMGDGIEILIEEGAWLEKRGYVNPSFEPWRMILAPALARVGRSRRAREVIEPAVVRAREFGAPWALGSALRAAGTIEQGHAGIETLREAVAILEASHCRLEHAEAQLELGAALRRANQRLEAQQHLRAALDHFHRNGAVPSATRAADELAATGARPRRAVLRGLEALTASELRVARMAADGQTNREIAQALFVTTKTIDAHLNHTYTKLDINSRKQLAQALQVDRG